MAMFFAFPLNAPVPYQPVHCEWHPKFALLAVAAEETRNGNSSGSVNLYTEDGAHVPESSLQRAALPTVIAWHPTQQLLATGWANGEMIVWNQATSSANQCEQVHESAVTSIVWSADGSRFVSGDESGHLASFKCGRSGRAQKVADYNENGQVKSIVFRESPSKAADGDNFQFFVGTSTGAVSVGDASVPAGKLTPGFTVDAGVHRLLFNEETDTLVAVGNDLTLTTNHVSERGSFSNEERMKLSGRSAGDVVWAGPGVLAACTNESMIRLWDLDHGDNYALSLGNQSRGEFSRSDLIQSVAYDPVTSTLAGASKNGMVFLWKRKADANRQDGADKWTFLQPAELAGNLTRACWGGGRGLLAVHNDEDTVSVLREHTMLQAFASGTAAVQVSSSRVVIEASGKEPQEVDTDLSIKGIAVDGESLVAWGGGKVSVYELVKDGTVARSAGLFKCNASACAVSKTTVFTGEGASIHLRNFQGASKQTLALDDAEGHVTQLAINGHFLVAGTTGGYLRLWDLSRREARAHGLPRCFHEDVDTITSVQVNCDGTFASFLGTNNGAPDPALWVWAVEADSLHTHGHFGGHAPVGHYWDSQDPRLIVTESAPAKTATSQVRTVTSLFVTPDKGLVKHHSFAASDNDGALLGVLVPFLYFARQGKSQSGSIVERHVIRDFAGLEDCDKPTRVAMMDFCYHSTTGNMDAAFKAVRLIKSSGVWENMARMCVTTRRLDVAAVCLGNMGNALAAAALRRAANEPEEAQVATLAVQLGMIPEAEALYRECGRLDLLNQLYQDCGRWSDALELARSQDRVNLRSTYYNYAKHLESLGNEAEAISNYELSGTQAFEVPRMLFEDLPALEQYVQDSKSKAMYKWWAQYLESVHDMDGSLKYYTAADDTLSLVRVYCYMEEVETARNLVEKTQSTAAAYHLARHLENQDQIPEAIKYYSMSECYNNAIRLAKEAGMQQEMISLAMQSSKADMISAAEYCEEQHMIEKAVALYHKGGRVSKALELCFQHNLFQALAEISEGLDQDADPAILQRAADFFMENNQQDKAVGLLIMSRRFEEALDMCANYDVIITEDYAERMTVPKGEMDSKARNALLERMGDICHSQGQYQLATRKYTQAGKLVKAMRALLKGGDTEKIIYFTTKCRLKEVYVMAANYLQSLDWRQDADIMKNVIQFYTKGKALDQLSAFYEACAMVEIDDYKNYEKALGALNEALKCMSKAKMKDFNAQERRVSTLQTRIEVVKRFTSIKRLAVESPPDMLVEARRLLDEPDLDEVVRLGDIFGLMIDQKAAAEDYSAAYELMQEMRDRIPKVNIAYYVNMRVIEKVHKTLGIPLGRGQGAEQDNAGEIGEDIQGYTEA